MDGDQRDGDKDALGLGLDLASLSSLDGSHIDSIEAEAQACIAEIDALLTEASNQRASDAANAAPRRSSLLCDVFARSRLGSANAVVLLLVSSSLARVCEVQLSAAAPGDQSIGWLFVLELLLCWLVQTAVRRSPHFTERPSSSLPPTPTHTILLLSLLLVLPSLLLHTYPTGAATTALRLGPLLAPLVVGVLQPRVLDQAFNPTNLLSTALLTASALAFTPRAFPTDPVPASAVALCALALALFVLLLRHANEFTGRSDCELMGHVLRDAALPCVLVAVAVRVWEDGLVVPSLPSGPVQRAVVVGSCVGALRLYSIFLCVCVTSPITTSLAALVVEVGHSAWDIYSSGDDGAATHLTNHQWAAVVGLVVGLGWYGVVAMRKAREARSQGYYSLIIPS